MSDLTAKEAGKTVERRGEQADEEGSKDELLREFHEKHNRSLHEHNEKMSIAQETPVNHDPSSASDDDPRLSVTWWGPPVVSLSAKTYVLSAKLHYLSGKDDQPITIQLGGLGVTNWNEGEAYLFYAVDESSKAVEHEFLEKNYDDEPRPVSPENNFITLRVGDVMERQVEIWPRWWSGLEVGKEYELLMPRAHIGWWEYGTMDKFEGIEVAPSDIRDDGALVIPRSNSRRLQVVA